MPAHYPELNGVSPVCAKCSGECKQWKQVKVIICPKFKSITQQEGEKPTL